MLRKKIFELLHLKFKEREFDNTIIWAGNLKIKVKCQKQKQKHTDKAKINETSNISQLEEEYDTNNAKVFLPATSAGLLSFKVFVELYIKGITDMSLLDEKDIDARVWSDVNQRGFEDERGFHYPALGEFYKMQLLKNDNGKPIFKNNNAIFVSQEIFIKKTGVFNFTVEFSADDKEYNNPAKKWISINEIALNKDGMITVIPSLLKNNLSVIEICVRKYGAKIEDEKFISGKFMNVTKDIPIIPADIIYILPFQLPGTTDIITGKDVRKGTLGSLYAIKDFFKINPEFCSPLNEINLEDLISEGLFKKFDLVDILSQKQMQKIKQIDDLLNFNIEDLIEFIGEEKFFQLIGRAELRKLIKTAHQHNKYVIFDLVIMQTSRDNELINLHRDWYVLDENGIPKTHKIAWLHYSDVALFDLLFNKPLQNYLSAIAPFWIKTCDFDGVRIDASQTIDIPFLKQIKNRINEVKDNAIVLAETLCDMNVAKNIPADMIYSLFVDHHINIDNASAYIGFVNYIHSVFPKNTVAIAYFENHDSQRATKIWHEKFYEKLRNDDKLKTFWQNLINVCIKNTKEGEKCKKGMMKTNNQLSKVALRQEDGSSPKEKSNPSRHKVHKEDTTTINSQPPTFNSKLLVDSEHLLETTYNPSNIWDIAYFPSLLKNIQASVINATIGSCEGVRFVYAIETGSDYGEEAQTDFENKTVLYQSLQDEFPHLLLKGAYSELYEFTHKYSKILSDGKQTFLKSTSDKILAYSRYSSENCLIVACNLSFSPFESKELLYLGERTLLTSDIKIIFDTYTLFNIYDKKISPIKVYLNKEKEMEVWLQPLQTVILEIQ